MFLGAILETVGVGAIFPLLSVMGEPDYLTAHETLALYVREIGVTSHTSLIMAGAIAVLLLYILKNTYLIWLARWQVNFTLRLQSCYAKQLFASYLMKPYVYHLDHNTATLLRNVYNGPIYVFSQVLFSTLLLLTELLTTVIIVIFLLLIDPFLAVVVGGGIGTVIWSIVRRFRRRIDRQGEIQNRYAAEMYQWVNQGLGAIKETKVLGREEHFCKAYGVVYEKYVMANCIFRFVSQLPRFLIETLVVSGLLLLIIGKLLMGSTPGELVPFLGVLALAAFRIMPSANRIVNYLNTIRFHIPMFYELYDERSYMILS